MKKLFIVLLNQIYRPFVKFEKRTHDTICGFYPLAVLLSILPDQTHGTLLRYCTSSQVISDPDNNSVSYMAIVFSNNFGLGWSDSSKKFDNQKIPITAGNKLLKIARQALQDHLAGNSQKDSYWGLLTDEEKHLFSHQRGVFVTLFKRGEGQDKNDKQLRGCVGYIWPVKSVLEAVTDNAVNAATKDSRFQSLKFAELKDLIIEISVLTPPQRIKSWQEIKLGQDGIFMHKNGQQAVFLPSVAGEFGWDLPETLTQLSLKAGCGPDGWKENTAFDVFQAQSFEEHH